MKIAIVKMSTVKKYDRLDAAFYIGEQVKAEEIAAKEKQIRAQQKTVKKLKKKRRNDKARQRRMVEEGEVTPIV